jgi:Sulfotransferase domain
MGSESFSPRPPSAPVELRGLPTFLVIGTMKAGTTSLYQYLRAHPNVFMPAIKELNYFVDGLNWRRGLQWYRAQFARAPTTAFALGEVSPSYTMHPLHGGVPRRIAQQLPNVRLIYVLRDPVDRIRSHFQHNVTTQTERNPTEKVVLENPVYVDCSRYALQIEQYLDYFSPEQMMIVASDNLQADRKATMRRVFDFLGVDSGFVPPNLDQDFYRSQDRTSYPPWVASIRRSVKSRLPWVRLSALNYLRPGFRARRGPGEDRGGEQRDSELSVDTKAELRRLLDEDQQRLNTILSGRPFVRA